MSSATDGGREDLSAFVSSLRYKPGWSFKIGGPLGSMLCVFARTPDSQRPGAERTTQHQFALPAWATPGPRLERWVFVDCLLLAELHEAGEFYAVGDRRPFYPHHQDEGDPYALVDRTETP